MILTLIIVLLVLALVLPLTGLALDPQLMRIITILIVVALVIWLVTGTGLLGHTFVHG